MIVIVIIWHFLLKIIKYMYNTETYNISPSTLIDEVSSTEIYIGVSENGNAISENVWEIKKIVKNGTLWRFLYPDGKQEYNYAWSKRFEYTYT
jgi:hypothetical protein